ncbi:MAG: polymorphic outer membrane protein, partial [Myxococcaceae bacterium]|nr:polymorphic outer membrane protein [Myxococcaceae bacterium]
NVIRGTQCTGIAGPAPINSFAVQVLINTGSNEPDLHSNDLFGEGAPNACTSRGLAFDVFAAIIPSGPRGLVRNNIIHAGLCPTAFAIHEFDVVADPRVLENNDLVPARDGGTLYRDENQSNLVTAAEVNALLDLTTALNLSADPLFDGGVHLSAGSPCRNAGTATGAPVIDLDGDSRPKESAPDIGADEYVP